MGTQAEGTPSIPDMDGAHLGPKMRALNPAQRRFVDAALSYPAGKGKYIARAAGYKGDDGTLRVTSYRLFHDERIIAALREEADKRLRGSAVLGVSVLVQIAKTVGHKDQLKAAEALLNRVGFHETSEHKVTVEHSLDKSELDALAVRLAQEAGIDPRRLLGVNAVVPMIEHEERVDEARSSTES